MNDSKMISFSHQMVQAILEDRKTRTRRTMHPQPVKDGKAWAWPSKEYVKLKLAWAQGIDPNIEDAVSRFSPYGLPGSLLQVRETYYQYGHWEPIADVKTRAGKQKWKFVPDDQDVTFEAPNVFGVSKESAATPSKPMMYRRLARFMPRKYSRIRLTVTSVRIEPLMCISDDEAQREGVAGRKAFFELWDTINGKGAAALNPWVWVIGFELKS